MSRSRLDPQRHKRDLHPVPRQRR